MHKYQHRIYPHRQNGRYYNHVGQQSSNFFFRTAKGLLQSLFSPQIKTSRNISSWIFEGDKTLVHSGAQPLITWIGHSTFLIQINGINILTDPIFGDLPILYKRLHRPGLLLNQLPPIHIVLISHNHRDHLDRASVLALKDHPATFLVPHGDKDWFVRRGFERVIEHSWWEETVLSMGDDHIKSVFLPANHWSQRGLFDKNRSLWGSWMIEYRGTHIYFAGDTAYWHHFERIAHEFPSIDIALMPIGPCLPRDWMKVTHVDAAEAVQSFIDLRARHFIPMHWGTFGFGLDGFDTPLNQLQETWRTRHAELSSQTLHLPKIGQSVMPIAPQDTHIIQPPVDIQIQL